MHKETYLYEVQTPAAVLNREALNHNISLMADRLNAMGVNHRPHAKTHKCREIAAAQLAAGASGLTCATVNEAVALATGTGAHEILLARALAADASKHRSMAELARSTRLTLVVEQSDHLEQLDRACRAAGSVMHLLVELDIGFGRAGLRSTAELLATVREISRYSNLRFEGLMGYEAHAMRIADAAERRTKVHQALDRLAEAKTHVERDGHDVNVVSAGGTITYRSASEHPVTTEVRSGGYVFMHATRVPPLDDLKEFHKSLSVLMTVIGSYGDTVVLDGGLKSVSTDGGTHMEVLGLEGASLAMITEEHLVLDVSGCARKPKTGERLRIVSTHSCTTANLHSRYIVVDGEDDRITDIWKTVGRY